MPRKPLDGGNDFTDSELNAADKFMNRLKGVSAKNCPGHVGVYIGSGQIIHAPTSGDVVKISSANILPITAIRRYW